MFYVACVELTCHLSLIIRDGEVVSKVDEVRFEVNVVSCSSYTDECDSSEVVKVDVDQAGYQV